LRESARIAAAAVRVKEAHVVQSLSRHRTAAMLSAYSHFAVADYGKVIRSLEVL